MEKITKNCTRWFPNANGYLTKMFILVKSLITAQKTSSNNSSFFVTGPQATTFGLGARPAEADIRESIGHEIRTRQERSRTDTGKKSLFISPKPRTIISANRKENRIFLSELESSYERPMGIAFSPRLNFGLCSNPSSNPPPFQPSFNQIKTDLVDQEIKSMLEKRAIKVVKDQKGFLSYLFLVQKKGGGQRPVVNLKELNGFLKYQHFKMEGIHLVKDRI